MTRFTRDHLIWILEVMTVVHTTKGIRNDSRYSCIFSPRTTCPLLVIFSHWRNISKADGSKRTNINTNFHGCRTTQYINRIFAVLANIDILDSYLIVLSSANSSTFYILVRQLCSMFFGIYSVDASLHIHCV